MPNKLRLRVVVCAHTPLYNNIKRSKPEKCVPYYCRRRVFQPASYYCVACTYVRSYIVEMRFVQDTHARIYTYIMCESTRQ